MGIGHILARVLDKNPEMGAALGLATGLLAGIGGGAVGGYEAGGGNAPPLGLMDKLRLATKSSSTKSGAFARMAEMAAGKGLAHEGAEMAGKEAPNIFSGFAKRFGQGARSAKDVGFFGDAAFAHARPEMSGLAERAGYAMGNNPMGAWAHQNPGTAGAIGAGIGGAGLNQGANMYRDHRRREALSNASFGDRLQMALGMLVRPSAVADRIY
jgi:hypothetical protein